MTVKCKMQSAECKIVKKIDHKQSMKSMLRMGEICRFAASYFIVSAGRVLAAPDRMRELMNG